MERIIVVDRGLMSSGDLFGLFRDIETSLKNQIIIIPKGNFDVWLRTKVSIYGWSEKAINEAVKKLEAKNLVFN